MIELPRVDAVGVTRIPDGYVRRPRRHSAGLRIFCGLLVGVFLTTMFWTGVATLARYCLTSHAGLPFPSAP